MRFQYKYHSQLHLLLLAFYCVSAAFAESSAKWGNQEKSLMEFEDRFLMELRLSGTQRRQRDVRAQEVSFFSEPQAYMKAVADPYYGYQIFILIDKSYSSVASKERNGWERQPQTMSIFAREGDSLRLRSVHPISTGSEPSPGVSDTREGYMRIQSAQAEYVSKKYGEAMPYSLWFETEYGTAIHETLQSRCDSKIGKRASAGCIRLCPGEAKSIFDFVTSSSYPRTSSIVLLDKRTGVPIAPGQDEAMSSDKNPRGEYLTAPKVIQGYPAFVRIIDGTSDEKIREIENLIQQPTEFFRKYFPPISNEALENLR